MIVSWCKNENDDILNQSKNYFDSHIKNELNNSHSIDFEEISQNNSFLKDDSEFIIEICKEIDNHNSSETRSISSDENEIKFDIEKKENIINQNRNFLYEQKIAQEINFCFSKNQCNEKKIIQLFYLCENKKFLHEYLFNNIITNIVNILNYNKSFLENVFKFLTNEEIDILINQILKHTQDIIINQNGYLSLLFLVSLGKLNITNSILYFILSNFIFYCINPFSSIIICKIISMGTYFTTNNLIQSIIENYNILSKYKNGIKIIKYSEKYFNYINLSMM